jgi:hypothetical protein
MAPGRNNAPFASALSDMVTQATTSARATDPSKSLLTVALMPFSRSPAVTAAARAAVRFHIVTLRREGRAARCASAKCGASAPAPTISSASASPRHDGRAEGGIGSCLAHRHGRARSGAPVAPSKRVISPWTAGWCG